MKARCRCCFVLRVDVKLLALVVHGRRDDHKRATNHRPATLDALLYAADPLLSRRHRTPRQQIKVVAIGVARHCITCKSEEITQTHQDGASTYFFMLQNSFNGFYLSRVNSKPYSPSFIKEF
jgi:hypothetical protein